MPSSPSTSCNLVRNDGQAGMIVPTASPPCHYCAVLRQSGFQSAIGWFGLFREFAAAFSRCASQLQILAAHAWQRRGGGGVCILSHRSGTTGDARRRFTLSPAQIAAINPNTKTAPVFRARRDAELTATIYSRVPVLIEEGKGAAGNPWQATFHSRLWHMAEDFGAVSHRLTTGRGWLGTRWDRLGERLRPHGAPLRSEDVPPI